MLPAEKRTFYLEWLLLHFLQGQRTNYETKLKFIHVSCVKMSATLTLWLESALSTKYLFERVAEMTQTLGRTLTT